METEPDIYLVNVLDICLDRGYIFGPSHIWTYTMTKSRALCRRGILHSIVFRGETANSIKLKENRCNDNSV